MSFISVLHLVDTFSTNDPKFSNMSNYDKLKYLKQSCQHEVTSYEQKHIGKEDHREQHRV